MARVLLTDGEQRACLAATRSLGRAGHEVLVASSDQRSLAAASRFCRLARRTPSLASDADSFRAAVERIIDEDGVDAVIPVTDAATEALLAIRETRPSVRLLAAPTEAYSIASDKARLMEIARDLGVPVPRQVRIESPPAVSAQDVDQVVAWAADVGFPVIVKPHRSVVLHDGSIQKFSVRTAQDSNELVELLAGLPSRAYPVLVQERIQGQGIGAFLLTDEGSTLASFGHRRLREKPPSGGVSVYRESVELRPDVLASSERLLRHLRWTGVAMVEFREESRSGVPYLMEINGRLWGSLQLAIDAGVDFPRLLLDVASRRPVSPVEDYRIGVRSRWLWGDVDHLLMMMRDSHRYRREDPLLPGRFRTLANFLVPWRPGDRLEVLRIADMGPFLRESTKWLAAVLRG